jgi:hypothetical protein
MGLTLAWGNLEGVALPFMLCACVSGILTVFLWRAAWESGMPHRREPCATCVFEGKLIKTGTCRESCAVNIIPTLPLMLFLFTCTFALFFVFFTPIVESSLFPPIWSPDLSGAVAALVAASNGGAAVLLAAYFAQDTAWHRELFLRIGAAGSLAALVVGVMNPEGVGSIALSLAPLGLFAVLLSAALEHRARWGRPVLGLRSMGFSTTPLFVISLIGLLKILWVLSSAGSIH